MRRNTRTMHRAGVLALTSAAIVCGTHGTHAQSTEPSKTPVKDRINSEPSLERQAEVLAGGIARLCELKVKAQAAPDGQARTEAIALARLGTRSDVCALIGQQGNLARDTSILLALRLLPDPSEWNNLVSNADKVDEALAALSQPPKEKSAGSRGRNSTPVKILATIPAPLSGTSSIQSDSFVVDLATKAVGGLAKLIVDRAKQESATWFLDELGDELCRDQQIRELWFRQVCALRNRGDNSKLSGYGSGAALFQALQGAARNDLARWPGVATGLGVANVINNPQNTTKLSEAFGDASAQILIEGRSVPETFSGLGALLHNSTTNNEALAQALSCALTLPEWFIQNRSLLRTNDASQAVVLSGLVRTTSCAALVDTIAKKDSQSDLEKLQKLSALAPHIVPLISRAQTLVATLKRFSEAARTPNQTPEGNIFAALEVVTASTDTVSCLLGILKATRPDVANNDKMLKVTSRFAGLLKHALSEDWAALAADVAYVLGEAGQATISTKASKYLSALVAIASAKDSDEVAKLLDQLASPAGGWRGKHRSTHTIAITAHAGFFAGTEIRHGSYGANWENWAYHIQPPALALPVGLDATWGGIAKGPFPSVGIFVSLIDPAAFIQYDDTGKVAGASLKTVLAPGLGFRISLGESPFCLLAPLVIYRPGFRQYGADALGTGADALQIGGMLSVDVTLLELLGGRL